ncbi:hypothetical protein HNR39_003702 [Glaciimonas immobilis]|uniref:Uncharacterized protein n=1 Tax=Glaciimonas immobilis TaxID=728004 RepID=A0A840RYX0_9BURK|nr:hypothetical protein [Glaciimonas immobilis]
MMAELFAQLFVCLGRGEEVRCVIGDFPALSVGSARSSGQKTICFGEAKSLVPNQRNLFLFSISLGIIVRFFTEKKYGGFSPNWR